MNYVEKVIIKIPVNDKPKSVVTTPAQDKNNNECVKEETPVKKVEMFKYSCGVCSFQTPNQVVMEEHRKTCK